MNTVTRTLNETPNETISQAVSTGYRQFSIAISDMFYSPSYAYINNSYINIYCNLDGDYSLYTALTYGHNDTSTSYDEHVSISEVLHVATVLFASYLPEVEIINLITGLIIEVSK